MPRWGLTTARLESRPWGLPAAALRPAKLITDPVHGDVFLSRLEEAAVDSPPFQRLRRVRQLGNAHIVYPSATHTRFAHSLGTLRVAQDLLDAVFSQRRGIHRVPDRFDQVEERNENRYQIEAEITVLARLGGLLHDLCHVPVGHTVEDDLGILTAHDQNEERFEYFWAEVLGSIEKHLAAWAGGDDALLDELREMHANFTTPGTEEYELCEEVRYLVLSSSSKTPPESERRYPFVSDLIGNTICADLLDYLLRDHKFTGLPAEYGKRFLSGFFVVPDDAKHHPERLALSVTRGAGVERTDIVTELLKLLRYRYELTERVLFHHAKIAADVMWGKALEQWHHALWLGYAKRRIIDTPDFEGMLGNVDGLRRALGDSSAEPTGRADAELEQAFRTHGDDELLGVMRQPPPIRRTRQAVHGQADRHLGRRAEIADALAERRLFRLAARASWEEAQPTILFERFGKDREAVQSRREAERDAELFAEIDGHARVALWFPNPAMKLKLAGVLVDHHGDIEKFMDYEGPRRKRGNEIYEDHKGLWACMLFVDRAISPEQEEEVAVRFASDHQIRWDRYAERFGQKTDEWIERLALSRVAEDTPRSRKVDDALPELLGQTQRASELKTFAAVEQLAREVLGV